MWNWSIWNNSTLKFCSLSSLGERLSSKLAQAAMWGSNVVGTPCFSKVHRERFLLTDGYGCGCLVCKLFRVKTLHTKSSTRDFGNSQKPLTKHYSRSKSNFCRKGWPCPLFFWGQFCRKVGKSISYLLGCSEICFSRKHNLGKPLFLDHCRVAPHQFNQR
jgi:hypothetical protein